ncbi:MAG TPA: hypothetical protein VJN96_11520 [Vicinamibacterales bacterium]|nr:hypothetical protein [Vicinamibacterales bacterium]
MTIGTSCNGCSVETPPGHRDSSADTHERGTIQPRPAKVRGWLAALIGALAVAGPAAAQAPPSASDATSLAKQTQNPVSSLTSVPLQFNFNGGGDLKDQTLFNLNLQPVIPFRVTDKWNAIARTIVPINSVPAGPTTRYSGIGDIQEQLYFSPANPGKIIWGAGPMFSFPTATAAPMQTGTWAVGPGAVVLTTPGPWVVGGLVQQFWPMVDDPGDTDPRTDLFVLQPFVNYNFGPGWALGLAPIITANWDAESGQQWTVPLGVGITRVTMLGTRPMSVGIQYYYNVKRPDGAPAYQLRFVLSLLYPRK